MAIERPSSSLPPAQPSYILRGHTSQIHSVQFVRHNSRLLTGDADGWIVFWKLETKRALAVWKAHDAAILGTDEWGCDKFVTHGRDHNLRIWQLRASDEPTLSTTLPAEDATSHRPKPWLLHTLPVNTLNFCAFSMWSQVRGTTQRDDSDGFDDRPKRTEEEPILVAVPARDDKKIEVYQFPDERLKCVVPRVQSTDTGMVMAVKLAQHPISNSILVFAGYEGGHSAIHRILQNDSLALQSTEILYLSQPHTQPVLSLDVSPDANTYFTSSADAIIAAHRVPELANADNATALDDISEHQSSELPVVDPSTALLPTSSARKGHISEPQPSNTTLEPLDCPEELGPSTSASSSLSFTKQPISSSQGIAPKPAGLSSLLFSTTPNAKSQSPPHPTRPTTIQPPYKTINTKHAGQQSLRVRSDGRIFVTGGWDSRIRVYSTKALKEVAVLKWHKEGVYAVDFAEILTAEALQRTSAEASNNGDEVAKRETGLGKLQKQREEQMQLKHWVAAGAKDGKVSLWEVF